MSIRFEHTANDGGANITFELSDHVTLPDLLEEFKRFILASSYIVDPVSTLEFVNDDSIAESKLAEENARLKRKIKTLKHRVRTLQELMKKSTISVDLDSGHIARILGANLDVKSNLSDEIAKCGCRTDGSDIPCIFHN